MAFTLSLATLSFMMIAASSAARIPYGIRIPYPYGATDPLESPPRTRDLAMGDTLLTPDQKKAWVEGIDMSGYRSEGKRKIFHWPGAVIPYEIDCSLRKIPKALSAIIAAVQEWKMMTCVKFVKRTTEKDYLVFLRDSSCWATQGKIDGQNRISVGEGCESRHVISHAIGHVVGLWHPQNRMDRNDYIRIFWQNIDAHVRGAYTRVDDTDGGAGPYDYGSIMHFPWDAFTNTGLRTMLALQRVEHEPYKSVSALDALQVSILYECEPPLFAKAMIKKENLTRITVELKKLKRKARSIRTARAWNACVDRNGRCPAWASAGFCEKDRYVRENCKKSCNIPCGTRMDGNCKDKYQSCPIWARAGYCMRDRLAQNCKRSCNRCERKPMTDRCKDAGVYCKKKARMGQCRFSWVKNNCRLSCNLDCRRIRRKSPAKIAKRQTDCVDKYPFCKRWSQRGLCKKYRRLDKICKASCLDDCKIVSTTPKPKTTTQPPVEHLETLPLLPMRAAFPTNLGQGFEFAKGLLCIDRDKYCSMMPISRCDTDTWMRDNCAKTCKSKDCDKVILKPAEFCADPLGLSFDGGKPKIPDSAFNASSHFRVKGWRAGPENARLYLMDDSKKMKIGAWCAKDNGNDSWIQVDLGGSKRITFIATQGRDKYFERVKAYKVAYSLDGKDFKVYNESGKERIFNGNCDNFTPLMHIFHDPFMARFVRVYPIEFNFACLRMELYGC